MANTVWAKDSMIQTVTSRASAQGKVHRKNYSYVLSTDQLHATGSQTESI